MHPLRRLSFLLLLVVGPLLALELGVRFFKLDTETAQSPHFKVGIPLHLLANPDWVALAKPRLNRPDGIPADQIRWLSVFEPARYVLTKMRPDVSIRAINNYNRVEHERGISFELTSNRWGFRGRDWSLEKPDGTYRVLAIGDSSTFGWGVDAHQTYLGRLGTLLQQRHPGVRIETLNLAVPGTTSAQGLEMWRREGRRFDPDFVLVGFGANDSRKVNRPKQELIDEDYHWSKDLQAALHSSRAYLWLRKGLFSFYDPFAGAAVDRLREREPEPAVPVGVYADNVERFAEEIRGAGASVGFVGLCLPELYNGSMFDRARRHDAPFFNGVAALFEVLGEVRADEAYHGLAEYYRRQYGRGFLEHNPMYYVSVDGCHPNRIGHDVVARGLLPWFEGLPGAASGPP